MRLWPRTLSGRLIIILLTGLVVAQAASLVLHFRDRGHAIYRMGGLHLVERIVGVVQRMDPLTQAERGRVAAESSSRLFEVQVRETFAPIERRRQRYRYRRFARFVGAQLEHELGPGRAVDAAVSETRPPRFGPATVSSRDRPSLTRHQPLHFVARVALPGGAVDFLFHMPRDPAGPEALLWSMGILLVSVILLVLFAVRQTTRPLYMLSRAATRLGDDINEPPLAETGPREVQDAARAFNRMQRKIQDYLRQRSELLAAVSHDLKTPITRLRIRTEMLDDDKLKEKFEADLKDMESMVNEAMDFVRGTDQHEAKSHIDLGALVESVQDDFDPGGERVELNITETPPYTGRPLALKRCLSNLLDNALKYASRVSITLKRADDRVLIEFRDDGPGLPEALLERVFEPFYRAEPSRSRATGGSGLGLAIARGIAHAHGGDVSLRNHPDGGLVATLSLPET